MWYLGGCGFTKKPLHCTARADVCWARLKFFCGSQAVSSRMAHSSATEWEQMLKKEVREGVMRSGKCDVVDDFYQ